MNPGTREAEKQHVQRLQNPEHLAFKPFLGGTGLSVDRARIEISIFASMLASLPAGPGSTVLDLGAGCCWISEWLQKLHYRTVSLDICTDMLQIGLQRLARRSWVCTADMSAIPLKDDSMDAALCYGALHHVPDWRHALEEVHRVLRHGGVLILQEPGKGHHREPESVAQMQQFGVLEQELPVHRLRRACRKAGFSRVIVRPMAELAHELTRILEPYRFFRLAPKLFVHKRIKRIKADILESLLNLFSPLHVVVACKGAVNADSSRPDTMVAHLKTVECTAVVGENERVPFCVHALNTGQTRWLARGRRDSLGQVRLGISLYRSPSELVDLDYVRFEIPHDVEPGEEVTLRGSVHVPEDIDDMLWRFDLVAEGIAWFSEKGSKPVFRACRVVRS
jgi:SAM-dependent methyltransferase